MKLSLVIPIYNASEFINDSMQSISHWMKSIDYTLEVILVNDGSSDNTKQVVEDYIKYTDSKLKLISYDDNKGKGYAVKQGMLAAAGDFRIFTDADIPFGFDILEDVLNYLDFKEFDVCVGNRRSKNARYFAEMSFMRKLSSKVFTSFISRYVVTGINDTQCGLKGFTAQSADLIFPKIQIKGFGFDVEILYLCYKLELDIKRIPVTFEGNENSTINLVKDSINMLGDILLIPVRYNFTKKYI